MIREENRKLEQAGLLFDRAIKAGYDEVEVYLQRAHVRAACNDADGASEDALRVLQSDRVTPFVVREALRLVRPDHSVDIAESAAVAAFDSDDRIWLATELSESREAPKSAVSILQPIVRDDSLPEEKRALAREALASAYIGIGEFAEAEALFRHGGRDVGDMDIQSAFNYGMALWGKTGAVIREPFARTVELDQSDSSKQSKNPNYFQCLAVANWAVGDAATASEFVRRSQEVLPRSSSQFSCWRYYRVAANKFGDDLHEIIALIGGDTSRIPRFIAEANREPPDHIETIRR